MPGVAENNPTQARVKEAFSRAGGSGEAPVLPLAGEVMRKIAMLVFGLMILGCRSTSIAPMNTIRTEQ